MGTDEEKLGRIPLEYFEDEVFAKSSCSFPDGQEDSGGNPLSGREGSDTRRRVRLPYSVNVRMGYPSNESLLEALRRKRHEMLLDIPEGLLDRIERFVPRWVHDVLQTSSPVSGDSPTSSNSGSFWNKDEVLEKGHHIHRKEVNQMGYSPDVLSEPEETCPPLNILPKGLPSGIPSVEIPRFGTLGHCPPTDCRFPSVHPAPAGPGSPGTDASPTFRVPQGATVSQEFQWSQESRRNSMGRTLVLGIGEDFGEDREPSRREPPRQRWLRRRIESMAAGTWGVSPNPRDSHHLQNTQTPYGNFPLDDNTDYDAGYYNYNEDYNKRTPTCVGERGSGERVDNRTGRGRSAPNEEGVIEESLRWAGVASPSTIMANDDMRAAIRRNSRLQSVKSMTEEILRESSILGTPSPE